MIPVAISTSQGAEVRNAMAFVAIGGLISSTALTLVVVPVAYLLLEGARERTNRGIRRMRARLAKWGIGTVDQTDQGRAPVPNPGD